MERRQVLQALAFAGIAGSSPSLSAALSEQDKQKDSNKPKIAVFTKSFQTWDIPKVCQKFKAIGLDGLDLTVRKKGHILPENVCKELPLAVQAAKKNGVEIVQITSDIVESNAAAETLFKTASDLGIQKIKLGYFRSKVFGTLKKKMAETKKTLEQIAALAARYKVMPCVHVHSNNFIPSHGTMLYELIRDIPTDRIGAYVDSLHMVYEGGGAGWKQGLELLGPWIQLCAIKNFEYVKGDRDKYGKVVWKTRTVPPADGISPIPKFVAMLKKLNYKGPYSLHSEYKGRHSFEDMDTDGCYEQTKKDLQFFRQFVG